jgi:hypothetical protein
MTGWYIFVCDRGFVVVGRAELCEELALCWRLPVSATIRRWGTTQGLAQLQHGPTKDTVTDDVCVRTLPFRSVIDVIHITGEGEKAWAKKLRG